MEKRSQVELLEARLHKRFLSRQLHAIFVALKLQQVLNMFKNPCDIVATNRPKNRTWFTRAVLKRQTLARQKLHRVAATKIACVNEPLEKEFSEPPTGIEPMTFQILVGPLSYGRLVSKVIC